MTSAERALAAVRERKFERLDMGAVKELSQHADARNLSVGDLDEAAWLVRVIDAAVAEALPRWVPVTERLPEPSVEVLVTHLHNGKTYVEEASYRDPFDAEEPGSWWSGDWDIHNVIAWQPKPAPWVAP